MSKGCLLLAIVLIACLGANSQKATCPAGNSQQIFQDSLTISSGGNVNLQNGQDIQCYNYTLATPFTTVPGVAIAVNNIQSSYSLNLFFSIKAINSDSNGVIPFIIRTHWGYTKWTKITFSFLAESSSNVEAGYYQIDTASLSNCYNGKSIMSFIPFANQGMSSPNALTFLNGFQISSVSVNNTYSSPFEVQIVSVAITNQGIQLILSSTSETQIHAIFISYIAYDASIGNLVAGTYRYEQYAPVPTLNFNPLTNLSNANVAFHGLNGFIVQNNRASFSLSAVYNSGFNFASNSWILYLSYSYFYLIGGPCGQCIGNSIFYNGNCLPYCPPGTSSNGQTCIACPVGQIWSGTGTNCVSVCFGGQTWNSATSTCVCPSGLNWNGLACITCSGGTTWNSATNSCQCRSGSNFNGFTCITCPSSLIWNAQTFSCQCPSGTNWNGIACISCASGSNWNGNACVTCSNGQVWNTQGLVCLCPTGSNWNSYSCVSCPSGQVWSITTNSCSCPSGQNWNGFSCMSCSSGRSWSFALNSCVCPTSQNWNGVACITCSAGSNWNGFTCITCTSGQVWNSVQTICQCPSGQQWNGSACITSCPVGMSNINGLCSCPTGTYNLNGACVAQPTCSSGQTWNGVQCIAISCPAGTFWSGSSCTSTTITCPAGTYSDGTKCITNTTSCPAGTTWNGVSCQTNSQCPSGTYLNGTQCSPLSQICPVGLIWQNGQCTPVGNNCPTGTYYNGAQCIPYQACTNGQVWNATVTQCVCPTGTYWNGNICIQCSGGQIYQANAGCFCPNGTFYDGSRCNAVPINQCANVSNSMWSGSSCVCNIGYSVIGMQCVCQGLAINSSFCDRCSSKPKSTWINGICQCNIGFSEIQGQCVVPTAPVNPPSVAPSCSVATYWDGQQLRCLPCSDGCLSCTTCYSCTQCSPGYNIDFATSLCGEVCGDAKRFTLPCDDGNNINGDGCSSDCKIELGYSCYGGSPNSKDSCTKTLPQAVAFTATGQSHLYGKIVLNVQANYLPLALIQSANDCANRCNNVLSVNIVSGDKSAVSIVASYIPTTSYSFSIEINFQKEPIGLFTVQIGVNQNLVQKYFSGIDVSKTLSVNVNPAFLARADRDDIAQ